MSVEDQLADLDVEEIYEPTINNLLQKTSLKWIFVGGKGGVGKTTVSSSIAVQMAKKRDNVLIISTDPAHNLSDAFGQKFTSYPTKVNGFTNLSAMEIDPTFEREDTETGEPNMPDMFEGLGIQEMISSFPGIDEAMGFAEVMKQVKTMEFSVIIFDTAPTGHTLRFLSFPAALQKGFGKIFSLKSKFGGLFTQMSSMFGGSGFDTNEMESKMESTRKIVEEVTTQFKNSDLTTFVPVMIPEFLSLFETERLIQELTKNEMDVIDIVVNQILFPQGDGCNLCSARSKMQNKYLNQVDALYSDFHVVKLPLLPNEVRGVPALQEFSQFLLTAYDPTIHTLHKIGCTPETTTTTTTTTTSSK